MTPRRAATHFYPRNKSTTAKAALPAARGQRKTPQDRMNKGEQRYAAELDQRIALGHVAAWWYEPLSWRLADDTRYVPDFLVMLPDGLTEIHEVKGRSGSDFVVTDTGWAKLKITAEQAPWPVRVVWQGKDGYWSERVL